MITSYTLIPLGSGIVVLFTIAAVWRRRSGPGAVTLLLMLLSIVVWCLFSAVETTARTEAGHYFWSAFSYIGLCNVTPLFLVFAAQYSGLRRRLALWELAAAWAIPLATLVLAFTNGAHHLIWTSIRPSPLEGSNLMEYSHGWYFWIEEACFVAISVVASVLLVRTAIRTSRIYVMQATVMLAGVAAPWIGELLYIMGRPPFPGVDTTSVGFAVCGVLISVAVQRYRLLDLVPQARAAMVDRMDDGYLVVDVARRIIDMNPSACRIFTTTANVIGSSLDDLIPAARDWAPGTGSAQREICLPGDPPRYIDVVVSAQPVSAASRSPRLVVVRDITARKNAEIEREELIAKLSAALDEVKTLSGLLPICSSCKKIRDDKGYWTQIEQYFSAHSNTRFSHGLCPDCMRRLYPDIAQDTKESKP